MKQVERQVGVVLLGVFASQVTAQQCEPRWFQGFGSAAPNGRPLVAVEWDSTFVIGGAFTSANGVELQHIARLDGDRWAPLGEGLNGTVRALIAHDFDGPGPQTPTLIAGGDFTASGSISVVGLAQFVGGRWQPIGAGLDGGSVRALATFEREGESQLIVAGDFETIGGATMGNIAAFDGDSWTSLGDGLDGTVLALTIYNADAAGAELIAGGVFAQSGMLELNHIGRWDGSSWRPLAEGVNGPVTLLTTIDPDGTGPVLPAVIAEGAFDRAVGTGETLSLGRWSIEAPQWRDLSASSRPNEHRAIATFDYDGSGPGDDQLALAYGDDGLDRWEINASSPTAWNAFARDLQRFYVLSGGTHAIQPVGQGLVVLGDFRQGAFFGMLDAILPRVALWDRTEFVALGGTETSAPNGPVHAIVVDDPPGLEPPSLVIAGAFTAIGDAPITHAARWTGSQWEQIGEEGPEYGFSALASIARGGGPPELIAGARTGEFEPPPVWEFNRSSGRWQHDASFLPDGLVTHIIDYQDGSSTTNTGYYTVAGQLEETGSFYACALNSGAIVDLFGHGLALARFEDLSGHSLLVGGRNLVEEPTGEQFGGLARRLGHQWSPLGDMTDWTVTALATPTPRIVYAARSDEASGVHEVVRWNGAAWEPVDIVRNDFNGPIHALAILDPDGTGPASLVLVAGGEFSRAGDSSASNLAAWDGLRWSAFGAGANARISTMLVLENGGGTSLAIAGGFTEAGGVSSHFIARRDSCDCYADCDQSSGQGVLDIFDFLCFQNAFASGAAYADCDDNAQIDVFDFLCFQDAFARGCP